VQISRSQKILTAVLEVAAAPAAAYGWTPLFIVASPRHSCGKTFVARLAADYLRLEHGGVAAFDLNTGDEELGLTRPEVTTYAEIGSTQAQIALFDRLIVNDGVAKVVDVSNSLFQRFFGVTDEIGFFAEAHRRAIDAIVLYPAQEHPVAVRAYEILCRRLHPALIVPVVNEAVTTGTSVRELYPFTRAAAVPLQIPALAPNLLIHTARTEWSFGDFHTRPPVSVPMDDAIALRSWTKRAFFELRELELRLMLEKMRSSFSDQRKQ
jgi:hypothetical protein